MNISETKSRIERRHSLLFVKHFYWTIQLSLDKGRMCAEINTSLQLVCSLNVFFAAFPFSSIQSCYYHEMTIVLYVNLCSFFNGKWLLLLKANNQLYSICYCIFWFSNNFMYCLDMFCKIPSLTSYRLWLYFLYHTQYTCSILQNFIHTLVIHRIRNFILLLNRNYESNRKQKRIAIAGLSHQWVKQKFM